MKQWISIVFGLVALLGVFAHYQPIVCYDCQDFVRPWDLAVNWTAATGMRQGVSLYDNDRLRAIGEEQVGPWARDLFREQYTQYIGPPTTALLILPFTVFSFPTAVVVYRIVMIVAFLAAMMLVARTLPSESRWIGLAVGIVALLLFHPVRSSIELGQVDPFVMIGLATGIWAVSRERYALAGVGFGVAALLKVSPAILIVYLLLRGKWQTAVSAALTGGVAIVIAALAGRPSDISTFITDVSSSLSAGSIHFQNQSIPGWMSRLFLPETDLGSLQQGLDGFRILGPITAVLLLAVIWYVRDAQIRLLDLGALIVAALLSGPITWNFYPSWMILTVILFADLSFWRSLEREKAIALLSLLALGVALIAVPYVEVTQAAVAAHWTMRISSGVSTLGMIAFFVGAAIVLREQRRLRRLDASG